MDNNEQDPNELPFDEMIRLQTKSTKDVTKEGREQRIREGVVMWKRFIGDYYGVWDTELNSYLEVPSDGLMKYPIIGPVIASTSANWLDAKVRLELTGASSNPEITGGIAVCRAIHNFLSDRDWTETNEEMMSEYAQLLRNYFVYSGFSKDSIAGKMTIAHTEQVEEQPEQIQQFACGECGETGPWTEAANETEGPMTCPACHKPSAHLEEAPAPGAMETREQVAGYQSVSEGDNFTKIIPPFLVNVDETRAKAGKVEDAQWINYNELNKRYELEAMHPGLKEKLQGREGMEWDPGVDWWHALETGVSRRVGLRTRRNRYRPDDLLQRSHWWFDPIVHRNWKSPSHFEHQESGFIIEQGQTLAEAFEAMGKEFTGLYIAFCGDVILWIDTESKNDCWDCGLWMMNAASFHGKAREDLLDLQTAINEWFTMFWEHGIHSAHPHTILDGMMFDGQDFRNKAGGYSYTRKGLARNQSIGNYVHTMERGQLGTDIFAIWTGLLQGAEDISGRSKASVGQSDSNNKTAQGQMLLARRAIGLMVPSQKSKTKVFKGWTRKQLRYAQQYWSDDRIRSVMDQEDHSFDDADIFAFRNLDLTRDLVIKEVEGSDIPVSLAEKEAKLLAVIQSGILFDPNVPDEIKSRVLRYAGIDYDVNNYDRDFRYINSVYNKIIKAVDFANERGIGYMMTPEDPAVPGSGGLMLNPETIQRILTMPGIEILPRNFNHMVAVEFLNDHIMAIASAEDPDMLLLRVLQTKVDEHLGQTVQNTADASAIEGLVGKAGAAAGSTPQPPDPEPDKQRAHEEKMTEKKHGHEKDMVAAKAQAGRTEAMAAKVPAAPPG